MRITDLELVAGPGGYEVIESASVLHCAEPVVVEPNSTLDDTLVQSAAQTLRRIPAPTVLLGQPGDPEWLLDAVDICLTTASDEVALPWVCASVDEVIERVRLQPLAAMSLVVLLRDTAGISVRSAVAEESATYAMLLGSASFGEWLTRRGAGRHKAVSGPPVLAKRQDGLLRLVLNRPEARNAIDSDMRDALVEYLELAAIEPDLHVEVRGSGECFSAGGDLEEFGDVADPATAHAVRLTRHPGLALHEVASRATCYVHGPCVGAGVEMPAFASSVVADPSATFSLPELEMGLIPGAGGTVSIPRRIGRHRTAWLAITGREIDARRSLAWGLVDKLEPVRTI
ncbi:MAG TPA: enoyl-CoA hydratase/isomerase family protein [Acidimicrobiales bacterium]|nr:enoyl-CoA hydratase/isomerase family protein [Acidimicrobiales bacterium]